MKHKLLITSIFLLILKLTFSQNIEKYSENKTKTEKNLNKTLVAILDTIHEKDQKYRIQEIEIEKKYGWDSQECRNIWKKIHYTDSINIVKVEEIVDKYGWLGPEIIGEQGNKTLFLVIQHADIKTQERYLPVLKEAVKEGRAKASYMALLEDRILLAQGKKQIYGSQLEMDMKTNKYILSPMIDPDNVDKRRAKVGLKPLSEYLQFWNIEWDAEKFKKRMKEIDKENK